MYKIIQNFVTLNIVKDTFEKWNQTLVSTMSMSMFASMNKRCSEDVMEEMADNMF